VVVLTLSDVQSFLVWFVLLCGLFYLLGGVGCVTRVFVCLLCVSCFWFLYSNSVEDLFLLMWFSCLLAVVVNYLWVWLGFVVCVCVCWLLRLFVFKLFCLLWFAIVFVFF